MGGKTAAATDGDGVVAAAAVVGDVWDNATEVDSGTAADVADDTGIADVDFGAVVVDGVGAEILKDLEDGCCRVTIVWKEKYHDEICWKEV